MRWDHCHVSGLALPISVYLKYAFCMLVDMYDPFYCFDLILQVIVLLEPTGEGCVCERLLT
jgi:hypothetical protein